MRYNECNFIIPISTWWKLLSFVLYIIGAKDKSFTSFCNNSKTHELMIKTSKQVWQKILISGSKLGWEVLLESHKGLLRVCASASRSWASDQPIVTRPPSSKLSVVLNSSSQVARRSTSPRNGASRSTRKPSTRTSRTAAGSLLMDVTLSICPSMDLSARGKNSVKLWAPLNWRLAQFVLNCQ